VEVEVLLTEAPLAAMVDLEVVVQLEQPRQQLLVELLPKAMLVELGLFKPAGLVIAEVVVVPEEQVRQVAIVRALVMVELV
jgi:hypothetical protein